MILYSPKALSDIDRVRNFLEIRSPRAATSAMQAIRAALARAEATPLIGKLTKESGVRQIVVRFGGYGYRAL
jgi:plasmid stabilization system protein ParE